MSDDHYLRVHAGSLRRQLAEAEAMRDEVAKDINRLNEEIYEIDQLLAKVDRGEPITTDPVIMALLRRLLKP